MRADHAETDIDVSAVRFDRLLQVWAPCVLFDAIDKAALNRLQSRSEFVRSALVDRLRADGIDPFSTRSKLHYAQENSNGNL
jgi:hypothetical protein